MLRTVDESEMQTFEEAANTFLLGTFNWLCDDTRHTMNKSL